MRVMVPSDRVALGLELPVLAGKPLPNPVARARELQAALEKHGAENWCCAYVGSGWRLERW